MPSETSNTSRFSFSALVPLFLGPFSEWGWGVVGLLRYLLVAVLIVMKPAVACSPNSCGPDGEITRWRDNGSKRRDSGALQEASRCNLSPRGAKDVSVLMSEDSPREENEQCCRCAARSGPTISTPDSSKPVHLVSAEVTQAATLRAPLNHEPC